MSKIFLLFLLTGMYLVIPTVPASAQQTTSLKDLQLAQLSVSSVLDNQGHHIAIEKPLPLVDFEINGKLYSSSAAEASWQQKLSISYQADPGFSPGLRGTVTFNNISGDTLTLSNVVPFGRAEDKVFITGLGDHPISRTHLFLPHRQPVNVIVPDNAWELGFSESPLKDSLSLCGLVRRTRKDFSKGSMGRFETVLYPGGKVSYYLYADLYSGRWQKGLREIFQQRSLYDVKNFNDSLYQRKDLEWIRKSYVIHLLMAWDRQFYDDKDNRYHVIDFLKKGIPLYGGDDVVGIWPTWPSLGVDQRNQFDLFRDLPGGLSKIKSIADSCHKINSRLFVCYNPWDGSTRGEGHLSGLADIIRETNSDGAVLDTQGASSHELQAAVDSVKAGVIMYPEGMAVPRDMQGVVAGRVHNALYYAPMLNLNKFIKPEFAIFRVTEVAKEPIRREFSVAFFNGYGTEINMFAPGIPSNVDEEYRYLGQTTRILRESSDNFTSKEYTPLLSTNRDSIWVNEWPSSSKTIYTIYSILPGGYDGILFKVKPTAGSHFVDIWHHRELTWPKQAKEFPVAVQTDAFNASWLGSNNEGAVDCIAQFPSLIQTSLSGDVLTIKAEQGTEIRLWAGDPSYENKPVILKPGEHSIRLSSVFNRYEGKFVIQLFKNQEIMDERIYEIKPGTPRLISETKVVAHIRKIPNGMVTIPAGSFKFHTTHGDDFISYPAYNEDSLYRMSAFYMDRFPVTNKQFSDFIKATHYRPKDPANFLKNWTKGKIPSGQENFPVVYVSYEDAKAYASWAGKRLPSEVEWQYAAQTPQMNEWPWKQTTPVKWTTKEITNTLTVKRAEGINPEFCDVGDGIPYAVGKYPLGANPYGLEDLVGCVWQLTNDVYQSGSYRYILMKGGSYFNPSSSWWYVQGGARPLTYRQYLLRVSPGFERNATVGFRCVEDMSK